MITAPMDKGTSPEECARETIEIIRMSMDENLQFLNQSPSRDQIANQFMRIWRLVLSWRNGIPEHSGIDAENLLIKPRMAEINEWIRMAEESPCMWDAMFLAFEALTSTNRPIPENLSGLAVRSARGDVKKPARRGQPPKRDRDIMILGAIRAVLEAFPNLAPTRHGATAGRKSACEIVREILPRFGIVLNRRSVEKIWERRNELAR